MAAAEGHLLRWNEGYAEVRATEIDVAVLVEAYSSILYRVAFSVLRSAAEAEDIVQETFLRVLRHKKKLHEIQDMRVWLVRIAWNLALDRKRSRKLVSLEEEGAEIAACLVSKERGADTALIAAQGHARVLRAMDKLPRKEREVLLLSAVEELGTAEIAAIQGTTESSVRSALFRARQRLRTRLTADEGRKQR